MRRYRVYLNSYYAHYTKDSSKVREQGVPGVPITNKNVSKTVYDRLKGFKRSSSQVTDLAYERLVAIHGHKTLKQNTAKHEN